MFSRKRELNTLIQLVLPVIVFGFGSGQIFHFKTLKEKIDASLSEALSILNNWLRTI